MSGATVRLGLIGDNIRTSRSPDLHRFCGRLTSLDVTYELLIPPELGLSFDALFDTVRDEGYRGVNVTYPYKERVVGRVRVEDPEIRRIGSVNTVLFEPDGPRGFNTDHTGFLAAFRAAFGRMAPGRVALVGAGGVGRAIAFALSSLGAAEIRILDSDRDKARALADSVAGAVVASTVEEAAAGADGVVNATPVGMSGLPGSAVPRTCLPGRRWAFEAVYTPVDTLFKREAEAAGLQVLSGYELFFHQGIQAFRLFTGQEPADLDLLRRLLQEA